MPHVLALSLADANGTKKASSSSSSAAVPRGLRLPTSSSTSSLTSLATVCALPRPRAEPRASGVLPLASLGVALASSRPPRPTPRFRLPLAVAMQAQAQEEERTRAERGKRGVDKTNPFIGYFQLANGGRLAAIAEEKLKAKASGRSTLQRQWRANAGRLQVKTQVKTLEAEGETDVAWLQVDGADSPTETRSSSTSSSTTTASPSRSPSTSVGSRAEGVGLSASRFAQDFRVLCSIGAGGQGSVVKVRSRLDACEYAIKKVVLPKGVRRDSAVLQQALREVKAMALMPCHPHVVRYHTAWLEEVDDVGNIEENNGAKEDGVGLSSKVDAASTSTTQSHSAFPSFGDEMSMSRSMSVSSFSSFEGSMGGFEFAESSRSSLLELDEGQKPTITITRTQLAAVPEELREDESVSSHSSQRDTTLVLYIQMELCRMPSTMSEEKGMDEEAGDSFHRMINRLTQQQDAPATTPVHSGSVMVHPSFSSWLRGSVDARSATETAMNKHKEGLKLYLAILDGVRHMHKCGVIHRDLKPENVFLHDDTAKIGDFGLSKSLFSECSDSLDQYKRRHAAPNEADHTTALGTFTYASPEQLGNAYQHGDTSSAHRVMKIARYSFKSDIFALGVILLELCCPCKTMMERSQVLTAVRHGVVPQRTVRQYPVEMALVLRMTAIDPAERPSAEEVIEQLQPLLGSSGDPMSMQELLLDFRDLQQRFALATHQLRDHPQAAQQLEGLVNELNDKVQSLSVALA